MPNSEYALTTSPTWDSGREKSESASLEWLLQCPLSFERMQDPVVLFPSGHSYDRKYICESLLHFPSLDPKSGVYYDKPLRYTTNFALRSILQDMQCLVVPYDDTHFEEAYKVAWHEKILCRHQYTGDRLHDEDEMYLQGDVRIARYNGQVMRRRKQRFMCNIQQVCLVLVMVSAVCVGVCMAAAAERQDTRERECSQFRMFNPALAWYSC